MIRIQNIEDKRIEPYRSLKTARDSHLNQNIFIAEGKTVTKRLLESDIEVLSIFALPDFFSEFDNIIKLKNISKDRIFTAEKSLMNQITGFKLHSGIMAIGKIPPESQPEDLDLPCVILNGVVNSENVGAIIRNAAAFGIKSIIFDKKTSSPYLRRAVRVSMGTIFMMKYFCPNDLLKDILLLKQTFKCPLIAAEINKKAKTIEDINLKWESSIVFGSEGKGIDNEILDICDKVVFIPINKKVDSLNVAASSAIFFYLLQKSIK